MIYIERVDGVINYLAHIVPRLEIDSTIFCICSNNDAKESLQQIIDKLYKFLLNNYGFFYPQQSSRILHILNILYL